jgi:hypothetical protein
VDHGRAAGRDPCGLALAAEVERLREVVAGDGARIFALQARVIALEEIEERAREVAVHDGPMFTLVHPPELHWIGQWVLKGDPD